MNTNQNINSHTPSKTAENLLNEDQVKGMFDDDEDDFFASLQSELEGALEESSSDDSDEDVLGEDFFSGLIDEIADEVGR